MSQSREKFLLKNEECNIDTSRKKLAMALTFFFELKL